ncbi:MAG: ATP-dependent 6-phosphofructokinase [Proteobacteria bacterium]|nr:ATP-dependent 6-phosphofructokinase [Pseudomonadota bacterium]MBS0609671.1 ATP-dependent 6-phosphofructokinase [Pseudomonadota bacterium]
MRVGVLTGGGDCPGLNAVIRAVTKSLIQLGRCEVLGIADGFEGLMGKAPRARPLAWDQVSGILHMGGTILGTSNSANPLRDTATLAQVQRNVGALGLDMVVVIGGDGTMSLAHGLKQIGLACVGVPKTIDNDIALCERSFGFDTAVATATEALHRVESTASSHHRVMIVETMGRHAGWLALEAGIAGAADIILLPEIDYDIDAIVRRCRERERERRQRYTIICIGEGAKARGGTLTVRERVEDSPDPVRLGGVAHVLRQQLQPHLKSEVRATVLGYVQRGGDPTPFDRVLATRFGHHAAQLVLGGRLDRMVTLQGGRIDSVDIAQVANTQRKVPPDHELLVMARDIGVCLGISGALHGARQPGQRVAL